jgi:hypothetical protein
MAFVRFFKISFSLTLCVWHETVMWHFCILQDMRSNIVDVGIWIGFADFVAIESGIMFFMRLRELS